MPLQGTKIIDFTQVLAGPFCTQLLGDFGAEVIKIESLAGDRSRTIIHPETGIGHSFVNMNRNKKSLAVDLKHPEGKRIALTLLEGADVLVENFKPGSMERLGLGYSELQQSLPRLVYCSLSGFGQTGPRRGEVAFDQIIQGYSGIMSLTGSEESGALRVGAPIADLVGGLFASQGILLALKEREKSGLGQWVDVAMLDAMIATLGFTAWEFLHTAQPPTLHGNAHPTLSPSGSFSASDGEFNISLTGEVMWERFCRALGEEGWLKEPRFAGNAMRMENRKELTELINGRLKEKSRSQWLEYFQQAQVPCGPIHTLADTFADPQVKARAMVRTLEGDKGEPLKVVANPVRLGRTPARYDQPPPELGRHTQEILAGIGMAEPEIDKLRRERVIA